MKDTLLYIYNLSIQYKIKINYKQKELTLTCLGDLIKQYLTEELITTEITKLSKDNYNNNYKSSNKKTFNTKKKRNESSNSKYSNKQQKINYLKRISNTEKSGTITILVKEKHISQYICIQKKTVN